MAAASMAAVKTSSGWPSMSWAPSLATTCAGAREALLVTKDRRMPAARAPPTPWAA